MRKLNMHFKKKQNTSFSTMITHLSTVCVASTLASLARGRWCFRLIAVVNLSGCRRLRLIEMTSAAINADRLFARLAVSPLHNSLGEWGGGCSAGWIPLLCLVTSICLLPSTPPHQLPSPPPPPHTPEFDLIHFINQSNLFYQWGNRVGLVHRGKRKSISVYFLICSV